jgi:hypothetical protein
VQNLQQGLGLNGDRRRDDPETEGLGQEQQVGLQVEYLIAELGIGTVVPEWDN